jgi:hypothetical protein
VTPCCALGPATVVLNPAILRQPPRCPPVRCRIGPVRKIDPPPSRLRCPAKGPQNARSRCRAAKIRSNECQSLVLRFINTVTYF